MSKQIKEDGTKALSIPESKLLVRKLERESYLKGVKIPLDYFHGMKPNAVVLYLNTKGVEGVDLHYVMTAIRDVIPV